MSSETNPQEEEVPPTRKTQSQPTRETQSPPTLETSSSPTPHGNPVESSYKVATEEISLGSAEVSGNASNLWGLSDKLDSWQVSSQPQDKVYFALQVMLSWRFVFLFTPIEMCINALVVKRCRVTYSRLHSPQLKPTWMLMMAPLEEAGYLQSKPLLSALARLHNFLLSCGFFAFVLQS